MVTVIQMTKQKKVVLTVLNLHTNLTVGYGKSSKERITAITSGATTQEYYENTGFLSVTL